MCRWIWLLPTISGLTRLRLSKLPYFSLFLKHQYGRSYVHMVEMHGQRLERFGEAALVKMLYVFRVDSFLSFDPFSKPQNPFLVCSSIWLFFAVLCSFALLCVILCCFVRFLGTCEFGGFSWLVCLGL